MKKNEVRAYNELNKAIGRLGELKNAIIESDGDMGIKYRDIIEAIKITLEHSVEEYNTPIRSKEEIIADIRSNFEEFVYDGGYDMCVDWDGELEIHEDADDVWSSPSDMFSDCTLDDIERLMDNEKFIFFNDCIYFYDEDEVVEFVFDYYAEDFIEYLVENRDDDEGDLNELLAEYENAEV